jgi:hypothetical protein
VLAADKATNSWGVIFSFSHKMMELIWMGSVGGEKEGQMLAALTRIGQGGWLIVLAFLYIKSLNNS